MITEMHQTLTRQFVAAMEQRAEELHLTVSRDEGLKNEVLFSRTKQGRALGADISQPDIQLPAERYVLSITPYTVPVIALTFDSETFQSEYEAIIWWTALIRSNLKPGKEDDLHLILVGPPNSGNDRYARYCGEWIEQDERFCRKLVWLPRASATSGETQREFIDRTFLARPWSTPNDQPQAELDAMSSFLKRISHPTIGSQVISDWLNIAGRGSLVGRDLAAELLAKYDESGEG